MKEDPLVDAVAFALAKEYWQGRLAQNHQHTKDLGPISAAIISAAEVSTATPEYQSKARKVLNNLDILKKVSRKGA